MAVDQDVEKLSELLAQAIGRIVVVMQMNLDLAETHPAQFDQRVQVFRAVLLTGIEERMDRWPPIGVEQTGAQDRVLVAPARDARPLGRVVGRLPLRLEVIDEAEQQVAGDALRRWGTPVLAQPAG